jgi:murein DD-endopeptidase MepM/ murein hydrolase activator NlpD
MRFLLVALFAIVPSGSMASSSLQQIINRRIEPNQMLPRALRSTGLLDVQIEGVINALRGVFDFRKSRAGDQFRIVLNNGELDFFDYRQGPLDEWQVRRDGEHLAGTRREVEVERKVSLVSLTVENSLYESALAANEDPNIALSLSDVFAWDIDFYRDVRKGDRVRVVIEKYISKGRLVRSGDLLAAAYDGETVARREVYRYQLPAGEVSYFQADGSSARKSFLKSPLKYAHVTSGFGSRLHPILKYVSAHNGVDYGVPEGTPVWAVADGTVTKCAHESGAGRHICIRHLNAMETCYLHLSRFSAGLRVGSRVSQKQIIAYSGNSGLSTGPHLHYALKRNGNYVNPLNQKFPRAEPVPTSALNDYLQRRTELGALLGIEPVAAAEKHP